jgi:unsaturated rhamnogalacturonyl hydrolase
MKAKYISIFISIVSVSFLTSCTLLQEVNNSSQNHKVDLAKIPWSVQMAESIMHRNPEAFQIDLREDPKWDYVHGLVLTSFLELYKKTGNRKYFDYVFGYADTLIADDGSIWKYKISDYNIDMVNPAKILFDIHKDTKDTRFLKAAQIIRSQIKDQPRTPSGGFWHKKRYPNQMWLDGLYMGAPFYARYSKKYENGTSFDDIVKQFDLIQKHTKDPQTGLLYHGWDESKKMAWANPDTGTSPNFWSRSMGWYAMAMVDVLDYLPKSHSGHDKIVGYLNELSTALAKYQHESGLWYQVTDQGDREGNYLEASGTAMFTYAIAKGVNRGYLDSTFMSIAEKGFEGLTKRLIKRDENGFITLTQVCAVAGLGGNPFRDGSYEYYINERKKDNDPKGTGPFILAALELNR